MASGYTLPLFVATIPIEKLTCAASLTKKTPMPIQNDETTPSSASAAHQEPSSATDLTRRGFLGIAGASLVTLTSPLAAHDFSSSNIGFLAGAITVLPDDGRSLFFNAIDAAQERIRIEICVLEDPQILEHIRAALQRGVSVRAIVDYRKYTELASEREHLLEYLTSSGGELHLSNWIFPRSFPKIILIDSDLVVYGSACLDQTTFLQYRDFATTSNDTQVLNDLQQLFENDWQYSAPVGQTSRPFNPTPPFSSESLMIGPVNASERLVRFYQGAVRTLDVYTEILGNRTLESELFDAIRRNVRVRLIAPLHVNGGSRDIQDRQMASLAALSSIGVDVHVNDPGRTQLPYMHARAAVVDAQLAYLGSISFSPDAATVNREVGLIFRDEAPVQQLQAQFESDYQFRTRKF